jgi:hypothetical protein
MQAKYGPGGPSDDEWRIIRDEALRLRDEAAAGLGEMTSSAAA